VPQEIKRSCAIYRVVENKGSYCLTAEVSPPRSIGEIDDIGLTAKEKYLEVVNCLKESALEKLNKVIPDSNYRRKVLRTIASYCPKSGERWNIGIGNIGRPLTMLETGLAKSIRQVLVKPDFEQRTVAGELVQIHLDENRLGLYYAPAQRVIHCTYEPELEDFIVSNLREIIQVYGQVQMDNRELPEKIVDVLEIEKIDVSPIEMSEIHAEGNLLILKEEFTITVDFDQESQEFVMEYPALGIVLGAETREDLLAEFCTDFNWIWQEYGKGDVSLMSEGAVKLREIMRAMVKEEQQDESAEPERG